MTRALLFYCAGDDGQTQAAMREALARVAPDIELRVWPESGDHHDIEFAAVWNPPAEFFNDLPQLQAVLALSAGVDRLLDDPALPDSIPVIRLEDAGMAESMAEYVLYGVLHAHRQMPAYATAQRDACWAHEIVAKPAGRYRVGILGAGILGQAVAERLTAAGYPTSCWGRRPRQLPAGINPCHGADALLPLAANSDVLVCLLPLTEKTHGILNARVFDAMPTGSFVINAARGAHLIDQDLLTAVQSGQLAGALLDVMHTEPPPPEHPFWSEARILMTPHIAAPSPPQASANQACRALAALLRGEPPPGFVDRASGY